MRATQILSAFAGFVADRRGNVTILSAAILAGVIGVVSLAAEYGMGLQRQSEDQRIADAAAFAAATYYGANSGASNVLAGATNVAKNVALLNGVPSTGVSVQQVTSPTDSSQSALQIKVTTSKPLFLAKVISSSDSSLSASGTAYAQYSGSVSACITALSTSTGITLSGGTSINAPQCGISTNATLTVPCGTTISAKGVSYGGSVPSQPCNGITTSTLAKQTVTDPLYSYVNTSGLETHVSTVAGLTSPAAPTVTSPTISFDLSWSGATSQTSGSCTASRGSGSVWTITCPNGGTYNFSAFAPSSDKKVDSANYKLALGGGMSVNFNTSGDGTSTYNIANFVVDNGSGMSFGPGTYNFALGFYGGSGNTNTFAGGGTYKFGAPSTYSCGSEGYFSICDTSTISFTGSSNITLSAGLYVGGGATLTMGSGTNNSFNIGAASDGNAFYMGGGSSVTLADTTSSSVTNPFRIVGKINADAGGGSCMTLGAAANHDINGSFATAGGVTLGAGVYTINGYLSYGNNGGGSVTCNGVTVGMKGTGVTIVYSAIATPTSGSCMNYALCFTAGFNNVNVSAPTSGTNAYLLFVGPQTTYTAGTLFAGGSGASMSGALYMPIAALTMSGGAYINTISGGCLQIVAQSVSMSGGATAASTCISSGSTASAIKLVM